METGTYTNSYLKEVLQDLYQISGNLVPLNGERDLNFLVEEFTGKRYLLKIRSADTPTDEIEFQISIMEFLHKKGFVFNIPELISSKYGNKYEQIKNGKDLSGFLSLQGWVEGSVLDSIQPWGKELLAQWGCLCGTLSRVLRQFEHPYSRRHYAWDPSNCLDARIFREYIPDQKKLRILDHFWRAFEHHVLPEINKFRHSVNYNDAHEHNIIISNDKNPKITGLIDFGDAVHTLTINELAIGCAYALMHSEDPLRSSVDIIRAYHNEYPLEEAEVSVLYYLIAARLIISVTHAGYNASRNPQNKYLQISQQPAWSLLEKWYLITPQFAHAYFRYACGWEPCPDRIAFNSYLKNNSHNFSPVVGLDGKKIHPVDLSVSSADLGHFKHVLKLEDFEIWINRYKEDINAEVLYGGYLEPRFLYSTDHYTEMGLYGPQWRSIHAGLDLWTDSREPVYAVHAGLLHSKRNNTGTRNYGPTIILEHETKEGLVFYSLYGHLTLDSLELIEEGIHIDAGQLIGYVGNSEENGEWPPHLHFQIMMDMLGKEGDFPGVVFPHEREIWASICPDPTDLIGLSQKRPGLDAIDTSIMLEKRNRLLGRNLSLSYQVPLHLVRGQMQYLYNSEGRKYLDTVNNVAHVGHEHPDVVRAINRQNALLNTNTRYMHGNILELADQLLATLPDELEVLYFVNSGSEANELAVRMCELYTGSRDMVVLESGYHGNSARCIELSSYKFDGEGGSGKPEHTHVLKLPNTYRTPAFYASSGINIYEEDIESVLKIITTKSRRPAGIIAESIVSCGGQIVLPDGFLSDVYKKIREAGGLCIADEVQTGLGRLGNQFWAFELHNVCPDIVTIGKPLGNGHPVAAVACTAEVATAFANGMEYFNTFGGNPVSCAAGLAVLNVLKDEDLVFQAGIKGEYFKSGLRKLQEKFPVIADIRGYGLFLGVELIRSEEEAPATEQTAYLINRMKEMGVLMSSDGPYHNVIKIKPPMCITQENIDLILELLEKIFRETAMCI